MAFEELFDKQMLTETALAASGGALGSVAFQTAIAKIEFLRTGEENMPMIKQVGAGIAFAFLGAALLGDRQPDMAKGFIGGLGGNLGMMLAQQFVPDLLAPSMTAAPVGGYGLSDSASSFIQLESARAYSGEDLPANVGGLNGFGRVSVSEPDPAELASLTSLASF